MRQAADNLADQIGATPACQVLGVPRSSLYRHRAGAKQPIPTLAHDRPLPARTLSDAEQTGVLDVLNSDRFLDASPRQVWATLLDEGQYLCSWRSK